jgi:hypothetical protein
MSLYSTAVFLSGSRASVGMTGVSRGSRVGTSLQAAQETPKRRRVSEAVLKDAVAAGRSDSKVSHRRHARHPLTVM